MGQTPGISPASLFQGVEMANLDLDPTGLWSLRKRVNQEISARFDVFSREIQQLVVGEDAFGLVPSAGESFLSNAASQRWRFLSSPQKLEAFQAWVKERVDAGLLLPDSNVDPDKPWLSRHLQSAYMSGIGRSFADAQAANLKLPDAIKELNRAQFLAQSLTSPLATDTLRLMYMRNFSQLKGVTEKMSAQMSVIMTEALAKGSGPAAFAARLRKEVGFSKQRAMVIARTELSYVQAEGQLDGYVNAGIGENIKLKVLVEWMTATNPCPMCSALRGVVFTIKEARGKIPAHPNCVTGGTRIETPSPLSVSRAEYTGQVVEIVTTKGRVLSVTENHVLLTHRGWVRAKEITDLDYLVDASSLDGDILQCPDDNHDVPCIADYFATVTESLGVASQTRTNARPEDFHGDGEFFTSKVDTKRLDGFLGDDAQSSRICEGLKQLLVPRRMRGVDSTSLTHRRALALRLIAFAAASDSLMGFGGVEAVLLRGSRCREKSVGVGVAPKDDTCAFQAIGDDPTSQAESSGQRIDGSPGLILLGQLLHDMQRHTPAREGRRLGRGTDDTPLLEHLTENLGIAVKLLRDHGYGVPFQVNTNGVIYDRVDRAASRHVVNLPVYDVETQETMYIANGILSSNCRCAWGSVNIYAPPPPGQKRGKAAIRKALGDALKAGTGKSTVAEARRVSKWQGASIRPTGKRTQKLPTYTDPIAPVFQPPAPKPAPTSIATKPDPKDPVQQIDKKTAPRVREAGVTGVPMSLPSKDLEGGTGMISTAKSVDGPRTTLDVSLTPEGSRSVQRLLGSDFESERIKFRSKDVHPADSYFKRLESTARMIESSKSSKDINPIQIAAARQDWKQLKVAAISGTAVEKEIANYYISQVESVLASASKKGDAVTISPFRPARNPLAPTSRSPYTVSKVEARFPVRTLLAGVGVDSLQSQTIGGDAYRVALPGGVIAYFTPHERVSSNVATPLAGSLSIAVPGKPSEASINAAVAALKLLGLGTKPPTPAAEELEYLDRVIALRGDSKRKAYVTILRGTATDARKVTRVKLWIKSTYGIDLKNPPAKYLPQGRSLSSTGRGPRVWDRWDIDPQVVKGESDLVLQHVVAGSIAQAIKKILDGGGDLSSTVEKLRKGMAIPANVVASDAPYIFLRIRAAKGTQNVSGLFFKPRSLTRTDAVSLNGSSPKTRETATPNITPADWASAAGIARNETRLRHGLNLLDEIEFIRVPTERDRLASLKVFRDAGVTKLPDGRSVSDIIVVQGSKTLPVRSE